MRPNERLPEKPLDSLRECGKVTLRMGRMIQNLLIKGAAAGLLFGFVACGTNTETPIYPLLTVFNPVGTPAILEVRAVESDIESVQTGTYQLYFEVDYYVTNSEKEFAGYNLYISSVTSSPDQRVSGQAYLPNGIMPSFSHTASEASTDSDSLVTQTVKYAKAPPEQIEFQLCEQYYFSLGTYTTTGIQSSRSAQVKGCAVTEDKAQFCPETSPCYKEPQ